MCFEEENAKKGAVGMFSVVTVDRDISGDVTVFCCQWSFFFFSCKTVVVLSLAVCK